jgi:hypothetical protein
MTSGKKASSPSPVTLLNLLDVEHGTSLQTQSNAAAVRIARELCAEGMTRAERIALHEFLIKVADAVRWPPGLQTHVSLRKSDQRLRVRRSETIQGVRRVSVRDRSFRQVIARRLARAWTISLGTSYVWRVLCVAKAGSRAF